MSYQKLTDEEKTQRAKDKLNQAISLTDGKLKYQQINYIARMFVILAERNGHDIRLTSRDVIRSDPTVDQTAITKKKP